MRMHVGDHQYAANDALGQEHIGHVDILIVIMMITRSSLGTGVGLSLAMSVKVSIHHGRAPMANMQANFTAITLDPVQA